MDHLDYKILLLIADGHYHSGQKLADHLSTSRAALNKRIAKINQFLQESTGNTYAIQSTTGRGYCFNQPFDGLSIESIQNQLNFAANIEFYPVIDSTNNYLINKKNQFNQFEICLAELQTAGRGRSTQARQKSWFSPFGNNIYCSISWQYSGNQNGLLGLSLVAGITVAQTLSDLGCSGVELKWPNDIYINNKKVAGILTEIIGEPNGYCKIILGFGLNVFNKYNPAQLAEINQSINQPWTCLSEHVNTQLCRNQLISALLNKFKHNYDDFIANGLALFIDKWQKYDILRNKFISINIAGKIKTGQALGIDNQGALLVDIDGQKQIFHSGEVSVAVVS